MASFANTEACMVLLTVTIIHPHHSMNSSSLVVPHPAEQCVQRAFQQTEDYVRREPVSAIIIAFGAGLLLQILPARIIARPISTLAVKVLPTMLLGLGVLKAFEVCSQQCHLAATGEEAESP
jgi:uncharacterized protein YacL